MIFAGVRLRIRCFTSQSTFHSHVGAFSCPSALNKYLSENKVSCSWTRHITSDETSDPSITRPGADPGCLERGFRCVLKEGVRFADFISFFLNIT